MHSMCPTLLSSLPGPCRLVWKLDIRRKDILYSVLTQQLFLSCSLWLLLLSIPHISVPCICICPISVPFVPNRSMCLCKCLSPAKEWAVDTATRLSTLPRVLRTYSTDVNTLLGLVCPVAWETGEQENIFRWVCVCSSFIFQNEK